MIVSADMMRELIETRLRELDVSQADASCQAMILVEAELRGHSSHGLQRLPRILLRIANGLCDPSKSGTHCWRSQAILEVDGENGLGPVVADKALDALISRTNETGIAVAAITRANHLGMLAPYVEKVARVGFVAIALSSSEALVHPFGGTRAMLGTNPIAIAIPTAREPFVLDLATSVVSMGRVHHYAASGKPLEPNWARDRFGQPTTDAEAAKHGALAPFGDAKGYGLGLAFELLVASIVGSVPAPGISGTLDAQHPCNKGDVFLTIQPNGARNLIELLADFLDDVRRSEDAAERAIRIPGDGSRERRAKSLATGIEIDAELWQRLQDHAPLQPFAA